jgi:hypothetical protein
MFFGLATKILDRLDKWINAPFFGIVDAVEGAKNDQKTCLRGPAVIIHLPLKPRWPSLPSRVS